MVSCTPLRVLSPNASLRCESSARLSGAFGAFPAALLQVDLAGSERLKLSGSKGERLVEAGNINKSLMQLGQVMAALLSHKTHVPYRDSKLTFFLADSIGGDAKTLMVACLSPSSFSETEQTLKFAARMRNVENGPAKAHMEVA